MILKGEELLDTDLVKKVMVDFAVEDKNFVPEMYDKMKALEPFGQDFDFPTYGIRNFKPYEVSKFGGDDKDRHVKFVGANVDFIAWNGQKDWKEEFASCESASDSV